MEIRRKLLELFTYGGFLKTKLDIGDINSKKGMCLQSSFTGTVFVLLYFFLIVEIILK